MDDIKKDKDRKADPSSEENSDKRNGRDRRSEPSEGFACVSTVGWICRREKTRRKDDSFSSTPYTITEPAYPFLMK
jgi:hypothetical protein